MNLKNAKRVEVYFDDHAFESLAIITDTLRRQGLRGSASDAVRYAVNSAAQTLEAAAA